MSEQAPETIWAQDADPDECNFTGGGWWDDQCISVQYPHIVEYRRADLCIDQDALRALLAEAVKAGLEMGARYGPNPCYETRHVKLGDLVEKIILDTAENSEIIDKATERVLRKGGE